MNIKNEGSLISEFLEADKIAALSEFLADDENFSEAADKIAEIFGAGKKFSSSDIEAEKKLLSSFKNNLTLLIQKIWVEKSDIEVKEQLLYKLTRLELNGKNYKENYSLFLEIINHAVFLMFGQKTDAPEFREYTLRIDPEFGIFWWYISSLPPQCSWPEQKCRVAMMTGMYFLANY